MPHRGSSGGVSPKRNLFCWAAKNHATLAIPDFSSSLLQEGRHNRISIFAAERRRLLAGLTSKSQPKERPPTVTALLLVGR